MFFCFFLFLFEEMAYVTKNNLTIRWLRKNLNAFQFTMIMLLFAFF